MYNIPLLVNPKVGGDIIMKLELSQKEKMLLEDDKNQEEICVTKYKSYAQQASDPELQQLFNKLSSEEQHHYDMLDQMLKGQEPDMSHNKLNQEQWEQSSSVKGSQSKHSSESWQTAAKNSSLSSKAQDSSIDKILCSDLLSTEKYVSGTYDTGIFEAANSTVRQALQHIQREEQSHGEQLFQYMSSHGMYNVK